jgi:hypothetical protein
VEGAVMTLLTVMVGAGVLGFPAVFANCGWGFGVAFVFGGALVNWILCCALDDVVARGTRRGALVSQFKEIAAFTFGDSIGKKVRLQIPLATAEITPYPLQATLENGRFLEWQSPPLCLHLSSCLELRGPNEHFEEGNQ